MPEWHFLAGCSSVPGLLWVGVAALLQSSCFPEPSKGWCWHDYMRLPVWVRHEAKLNAGNGELQGQRLSAELWTLALLRPCTETCICAEAETGVL